MALFNYATKEITLKIVYYGPGLSGKTTNIQYLHSILSPETKGKLLSLATEADRTLFFDFLPIELGKIKDFSIRFQLYTVPGQVRYNATRKVVLKGADAVVFVADSQHEMREQNIESFANMRENLSSNNIKPDEIPVIIQYNKRDLQNIMTINDLNGIFNPNDKYVVIEASAINGTGVEDSFKLITKMVLKDISKKHRIEIQPSHEKEKVKIIDKFPETTQAIAKKREIITEAAYFEPTNFKSAKEAENTLPGYGLEEEDFKDTSLADYHFDPETGHKIKIKEKADADMLNEIKKNQVITLDKINLISGEFAKASEILSDLKKILFDIKRDITEIKGQQEIKELRREQKDMSKTLQEIETALNNLKTKKSWFRFRS